MSFQARLAPPLLLLTLSLTAQTRDAWVDPSPHASHLVGVDPDVSLEVLDWGGSGRVIVLLAQLGQTAHIYDYWAPQLARTYHVVGITRRGYGESTISPTGYSAQRLATDIVTVLDEERLQRPVLVGNGFAGEEMSWIGARLPRRVAGLIYLDAAYDRTNIGAEAALTRRIPTTPPQPQDLANVQAATQWVSAGIGFPVPESEVRQLARFGEDGRFAGERSPDTVRQQILAGIIRTDYTRIRVPVLALYARRTSPDAFPGCRTDDPAVRQACSELYDWTSQHLAESERSFRTVGSRVRVIEFPGAHPFVFLSNEREVTQAMSKFVSALPH